MRTKERVQQEKKEEKWQLWSLHRPLDILEVHQHPDGGNKENTKVQQQVGRTPVQHGRGVEHGLHGKTQKKEGSTENSP